MKAVLLPQHGPAETLTYVEDHPMPNPGPGQVRVRLHAAALNRLDWWMRVGIPGFHIPLPHILGADAAGVIDALGEGVTGWQVGQRVALDPGEVTCNGCDYCDRGLENMCKGYAIIGEHAPGTYCEYRNYAVRNLLALPDHISFAQAAAASLVYLTAWHSLITRGGLKPGESVLIVGAGGGVNSASLQIAHLLGCPTYVVGSTAAKCRQAESLGADYTIDRSQTADWGKAAFALSNKRGFDVVVDNVGAPTMAASIRAARPGGRVLTVGNTGGPTFELDNRHLFFRHVSLIGSTMGPHADYVDVMRLVFAGKLNAVIGPTFPLQEAAQAHHALEQGDFFGKIILEIP
jgi:NADPH:quinone reductase-like Zn-dependent oxidoreductase